MQELNSFLSEWNACDAKTAFQTLRQELEAVDGVRLEFKARPGITYSLRGTHPAQQGRELFAMIDIIDDDPEQRWFGVLTTTWSRIPTNRATGCLRVCWARTSLL